jgi:hypothetical protein
MTCLKSIARQSKDRVIPIDADHGVEQLARIFLGGYLPEQILDALLDEVGRVIVRIEFPVLVQIAEGDAILMRIGASFLNSDKLRRVCISGWMFSLSIRGSII